MIKYIPITKDKIPPVDTLIRVSDYNDPSDCELSSNRYLAACIILSNRIIYITYYEDNNSNTADSYIGWKYAWIIEEAEEEKEQLWWIKGLGGSVGIYWGKMSIIKHDILFTQYQPATGDLQKGPDHTKWEEV